MSTAEATRTEGSVSLTCSVDGSLRELSDEELEQVAGGEIVITYDCCDFTVTVYTDNAALALAEAEDAHRIFGCGN